MTRPLLAAALLLVAASARAGVSPGAVPAHLSYEGRLEKDGFPVTGDVAVRFRLFDAAAAGNLLFDSGAQTATAFKGVFGSSLAIPDAALSLTATTFLEAEVQGQILLPRDPLRTVPYARIARNLVDGTALGAATLDVSGEVHLATASGNVGIGTLVPNDGRLEVKGGTVCVDTNSDGSATSCITAESDVRLKRNIRPIAGALDKVLSLRGVRFDWRWDEFEQIARYRAKPRALGVIAQEVELVFPEAMDEEIGGFKSVDYRALVPPLIEALRELRAENRSLQERLRRLEAASDAKAGPGPVASTAAPQ